MAYAVEVTIGTGNKVSLNYQSQKVNLSITYRLEREDTDVLAVVEDKADELVKAHALAWKRVKEGERPVAIPPEREVETGAIEVDVPEETQVRENRSTPVQARLIRSMAQQAGWSEEQLKQRIQATSGRKVAEDLSHNQAATLLVELGREERHRFEQERSRSSNQDEPTREHTLNSP